MSRQFGLIGRQISHSFSADYFNRKFEREGIDARYDLFDLESINQLPEILNNNPDLVGINVTSPYKREIIPFLDSISDDAREMNAVNVVKISRNGGRIILEGYNTDSEGFRQTLQPLLSVQNCNKALILGTGGASSAVKRAFEKEGIEYKVVSRKHSGDYIDYAEASLLIPDSGIIVNATPVGMEDLIGQAPALDYNLINDRHLLYDLIYNPKETLFLKKGKEKGAKTSNGLQMLLNQADLAWQIWNS